MARARVEPAAALSARAPARRGQKHQRREKQAQVLDAQGLLATEAVEAVLGSDDDAPLAPAESAPAEVPAPEPAEPPAAAGSSGPAADAAEDAALAEAVTEAAPAAAPAPALAPRPSSAPVTPTARRFVPVKPRSVFAPAAPAADAPAAPPAAAQPAAAAAAAGEPGGGASPDEARDALASDDSGVAPDARAGSPELEGFDGPRTISSVFANIAGLSGGGDGGGDPAGGDAGVDAEGAAAGAAPPALRSLGKLKVRRAGRTQGVAAHAAQLVAACRRRSQSSECVRSLLVSCRPRLAGSERRRRRCRRQHD
jgi:hypothetical protein